MKNPNFNYRDLKERSERYGTTTIIGRKSQFKGNTINVFTAEQDEIVIRNSYYHDHVSQMYSIKNNITTIEYHIGGGHNVKWLEKKFKELEQGLSLPINISGIRAEVKMNKGMTCEFGHWHYNLHHKIEKKGLMFQGNIDNIDQLKEMRCILSNVRNIIKRTDLAELVKNQMDHRTGEMINIATLSDSKNLGHRIIIDYDKLQKHDKRVSDHS